MAKAPIKIPNLYPEKTLEINGKKVIISAFKPSDKVYDIAIEHVREEGLKIQAKLNKIIYKEEEVEGEKVVKIKKDWEYSEDERNEISKLKEEINELDYQLVYGDKDDPHVDERMSGPMALLAQRGLKRFYHPNKSSEKLDAIDDIPITEGDVKLIANTMIGLTKPPSGLEKSIQARERENAKKDADKGK